MPSAADVEAGGVAMGDMQKRLLRAVEELTLHVIRIEEENRRLHAELEFRRPTEAAP
jgi:hypothetical protein